MRRSRAGNFVQAHPAASRERRAARIPAAVSVVDLVPIADVEFGCRAQPPHRKLHKTREAGREVGVELASIDPLGQAPDEVGAPACGIASSAIVLRLLVPKAAQAQARTIQIKAGS